MRLSGESKEAKKTRLRDERRRVELRLYLACRDKQDTVDDELAFARQFMREHGIDQNDESTW